jgi:hypothetical protein
MPDQLESAITAIKNGERVKARLILAELLRLDPKNGSAWYYLSTCVDTPRQQKDCLSRVLAIDSGNLQANADLEKLEHGLPEPGGKAASPLPLEQPVPPEPVIPAGPPDARDRTGKVKFSGGAKVLIGVLVLLVCCCWILPLALKLAAGPGTKTGLQASDPGRFKKAAGEYQLVMFFTFW